jgi:hypothetical protein
MGRAKRPRVPISGAIRRMRRRRLLVPDGVELACCQGESLEAVFSRKLSAQKFKCGVEKMVSRQPHKLEVVRSSRTPATFDILFPSTINRWYNGDSMPRPQKKYHYIYRTTCLVTGRFYVGMHSTDNLDDGYLGSGKVLWYSRQKYGDEQHSKEIIEMCPTREALKLREKEIVNEQLLADPLNINLKYGGEGGGKIWNADHAAKFHKAGHKAMTEAKDLSAAAKKAWSNNRESMLKAIRKKSVPIMIEAARSPEVIQKKKQKFAEIGHQQGEKNSMSGKCWITNGTTSKPVRKSQVTEFTQQGWKLGRTIKHRAASSDEAAGAG